MSKLRAEQGPNTSSPTFPSEPPSYTMLLVRKCQGNFDEPRQIHRGILARKRFENFSQLAGQIAE